MTAPKNAANPLKAWARAYGGAWARAYGGEKDKLFSVMSSEWEWANRGRFYGRRSAVAAGAEGGDCDELVESLNLPRELALLAAVDAQLLQRRSRTFVAPVWATHLAAVLLREGWLDQWSASIIKRFQRDEQLRRAFMTLIESEVSSVGLLRGVLREHFAQQDAELGLAATGRRERSARARGAVGSNPLTYRDAIEGLSASTQLAEDGGETLRILDFGCGPKGVHTEKLRRALADMGLSKATIVGYDIARGDSLVGERPFNIVIASNVLNVQETWSQLLDTIEEIETVIAPNGVLIYNIPKSPNYLKIGHEHVAALIRGHSTKESEPRETRYARY